MTSFQEFLQKKAEEQHHPARREARDEWVAAVDRLLGQINAWLDEADPEGILDRFDLEFDRAEAPLGRYKVCGLKISIGDLSLEVVPIAGKVVGRSWLKGEGVKLAGRIDMIRDFRKYVIMRIVKDGVETWEVQDENFGAAPLDKARFVAIIQDLLS